MSSGQMFYFSHPDQQVGMTYLPFYRSENLGNFLKGMSLTGARGRILGGVSHPLLYGAHLYLHQGDRQPARHRRGHECLWKDGKPMFSPYPQLLWTEPRSGDKPPVFIPLPRHHSPFPIPQLPSHHGQQPSWPPAAFQNCLTMLISTMTKPQ